MNITSHKPSIHYIGEELEGFGIRCFVPETPVRPV